MSNWQVILVEPAKTVVAQLGNFMMNLFLVLFILLVGWLISKLVKTIVVRVMKAVKIDDLSERISLDNLLAKGGITYSLSELIGRICYWLILLVTLVVAVNAIGLTIAAELLNRVVLYIPNIIAAIFIMILGMFVATLLKNIVRTAANNAGLSQAKFLANIAEMVVIVFTVIIVLEQLNIGARVIELIISIALASLGLGFAIAFGLGCKDLVGKFFTELTDKLRVKQQ